MDIQNHPVQIMIVEDEPKLGQLLVDYLQAAGYATRWLTNGNEVVPTVHQHPPALILLDLMLPGADGLTVCRELRRFSDVPIVMVTAKIEEIDRLLGLEIGADDYICKPYSPREVVARVKTILRRSYRPQENARKMTCCTSMSRVSRPAIRAVAGSDAGGIPPAENAGQPAGQRVFTRAAAEQPV